jgi:hypothetical protein
MVAKGNNYVDYGFTNCGVHAISGISATVYWYKAVVKIQNMH